MMNSVCRMYGPRSDGLSIEINRKIYPIAITIDRISPQFVEYEKNTNRAKMRNLLMAPIVNVVKYQARNFTS